MYRKKYQSHESFLFQVLDVLDAHKIEYCLWGGTLLGAVRDKDFLPNDTKDTDIAIDESYYWQVRKLFDQEVIKNKLKWHYLWRKEVSVSSLDDRTKVDMFFLEKNSDKYYGYSYRKNDVNGVWNHEWRNVYTAAYVFPTKRILFYGRRVRVPNKTNEFLTEAYGDWKIPQPDWDCVPESFPNLDKNYKGFYPAGIDGKNYNIDTKKYAYGYVMTTIERNDCIKKTIESVQKHCPDVKIYVGDQNNPSGEMVKFYESHKVQYYFTPLNSGLSWNRNFLVDKVEEPYVLIGDDDFTFTKNTKIKIFRDILKENKKIGIVGGALTNTAKYNKRLIWDNIKRKVYMIQIDEEERKTKKGYVFTYADLVLNFFLARKQALKDCKWDNDLKLCEHLEYFLRFKETKWKVAFTPNVTAIHDRVRSNDYLKFRHQSKKYYRLMLDKYNISSLDDIIGLENTPLDIQKINSKPEKKKEVDQKEKPKTLTKVPKKNYKVINYLSNEEIIKILIENGCRVCLMKSSCYQAVKKIPLDETELHLGVDNLALAQNLFDMKKLILYNIPKNVKLWRLYNMSVLVPFPVLGYLKRLGLGD